MFWFTHVKSISSIDMSFCTVCTVLLWQNRGILILDFLMKFSLAKCTMKWNCKLQGCDRKSNKRLNWIVYSFFLAINCVISLISVLSCVWNYAWRQSISTPVLMTVLLHRHQWKAIFINCIWHTMIIACLETK